MTITGGKNMTEKKNDEVTKLKEIIGSLQANVNILLTSAISHLKKNNQSIEDLAHFCGKVGAKNWSEDVPLEQVVNQIAHNMIAFGAKVETKDINTDKGKIIIKDWPTNEILDHAEITLEDFDRFYVVWKPAVEKQNLQYSFERDKDSMIISIKK